jgi:Glucose-repressible protein Grg1
MTSGASKEVNKNVAKDSNADVSTRATAAKDAVGDKFDETKHSVSTKLPPYYPQLLTKSKASATGNKEAAKH